MNKQTLLKMWDHIRQTHGITLRLIDLLPADKLDSHPIPNMRTPKELLVHMYDVIIKEMPEAVVRGEVIVDEANEKKLASTIKTREDLVRFVNENWNAATRAVDLVTDSQLAAMVKTPWGMSFPGHVIFGITHDEYLHHRGQLYAFVRALGATSTPMMWDFENNAPEFRPKTHAQA